MKPHALLLVLMLSCGVKMAVQAQHIELSKQYITVIEIRQKGTMQDGYLYKLEDSSILFQHRLLQNPTTDQLLKIPVEDIKHLKFRKKNSILQGAIIGAVAGAVIGVVTGFAVGDTRREVCSTGVFSGVYQCSDVVVITASENALIYGVLMGVGGAGLGCLAGSVRIKIPINGEWQRYQGRKATMEKYLVKQQ